MTDLNRFLHHPTITLLGQVFLHFLWQGAVVGLFLLVALNLLKPRNARLRYGAGSIALLAMLALPPLTAWWLASSPVNPVPSEPARHAAPDTTATTGVPAPVDNTAWPVTVSLPAHLSDIEVEPPAAPSSSLIKLDNVRETKQSFLPWLTLFWLLGASLLSLRLLGGWLALQRLRTRGTKRAPEALQSKLAEFSRRLRITRHVRLLESTVVHVPLVIGWLRPVILLPASAVTGLNPAQLETILAHELAHIRRHDALVNLLQRLAETLLFYHPAVWWVSCQVEREREHCCDDIAVSTCGDALMYATALAQIEGLRARHGVALAANGGSLLQRLKRLAGEPVPSVYSPVRAAVGLLTLTVLTLSITALSQSPTQAQEGETSLDARELQNMEAFVQLLGYVRYFHPSDAVGATDWDAFTVSHIESVEDAANPEELAERLATLFRPYAPMLRVFPTGESPEPPEGLLMPDDIEPLFVTMWAHAPLGGQLRSKRLSARVTQGNLPETIPYQGGREFVFLPETISLSVLDPQEPYLVELKGGVSAAIPLALYADSQGTLPHAQVPPEFGVMPPASEARALQLAAVATIWNAMQHFFSYWDAVNADWLSALGEALSAAAVAENRQEMTRILERLMAHLEDGHVQVYPVVTDLSLTAPFTLELVEGELVITTVISELAEGLSVGDVLLTINGESALGLFSEEEKYVSGAGQWRRLRTLRRILSEAAASGDITVEVRPAGSGERLTTRAEPIATSPYIQDELREPRPPVVAQLAPGIIYVDLTRVQEGRLHILLPWLEDAAGIVFDMRGYPNSFAWELLHHLTDRPLESAPFLVPIVTRPDYSEPLFVDVTPVLARPKAPQLTDTIAFIINGAAISSAESFTGLIERHGIGELVGEPTAGANGNVATINLPGGYSVLWTGLRVTKADGSPLFRVGVTPTIPVTRTREGIAAGRDELLEAAFNTVSGLPESEMEISLLEP